MNLPFWKDVAYLVLFGISVYTFIKSSSIEKAKPVDDLNARIASIEEHLKEVDRKLDNDYRRFGDVEKANKVTMKAILALLGHGLDGNNEKQMRDAHDELQNYLFENKIL